MIDVEGVVVGGNEKGDGVVWVGGGTTLIEGVLAVSAVVVVLDPGAFGSEVSAAGFAAGNGVAAVSLRNANVGAEGFNVF